MIKVDPWKDKGILYQMYIVKRMSIKDMAEKMSSLYGVKVTPQTIYNWLQKYELLKQRGKGRNLGMTTGKATGPVKKANNNTKNRAKPPWMK